MQANSLTILTGVEEGRERERHRSGPDQRGRFDPADRRRGRRCVVLAGDARGGVARRHPVRGVPDSTGGAALDTVRTADPAHRGWLTRPERPTAGSRILLDRRRLGLLGPTAGGHALGRPVVFPAGHSTSEGRAHLLWRPAGGGT